MEDLSWEDLDAVDAAIAALASRERAQSRPAATRATTAPEAGQHRAERDVHRQPTSAKEAQLRGPTWPAGATACASPPTFERAPQRHAAPAAHHGSLSDRSAQELAGTASDPSPGAPATAQGPAQSPRVFTPPPWAAPGDAQAWRHHKRVRRDSELPWARTPPSAPAPSHATRTAPPATATTSEPRGAPPATRQAPATDRRAPLSDARNAVNAGDHASGRPRSITAVVKEGAAVRPPAPTAAPPDDPDDDIILSSQPEMAAGSPPAPRPAAPPAMAPARPVRRLPPRLLAEQDGTALPAAQPHQDASAHAPAPRPGANGALAGDLYPPLTFLGEVQYLTAAADVERCCRRIIDDKPDAVGLDIEWIATFRQGEPPRRTALIQLCYQPTSLRAPNAAPSAGDPAVVALLHVAHSGVPPALRTLLCGGEGLPLRVGVRVVNDMCKLKLDFRLGKIEGVVDSAQEAKRRCVRGHEGLSLDALCQRLLQRRLAKDPQVRVSDWEQLPLSAVQKQYAAVDAYASLVVFRAVMASPAARAKLVDATWRNGAVQS